MNTKLPYDSRKIVQNSTLSSEQSKDDKSLEPAKVAKKLITRSSYIDYDLSQLKDSRGGFIIDDKPVTEGLKVNEPLFIKELPKDKELRCKECGNLGIDPIFYQVFDTMVCEVCKKNKPDKFSLLTKTEVKEDYLLTEDELRDKELFQHWSRPNPRKNTWNDMQLFLREQVERYAYLKWGGSEGLDKELDRRDHIKKQKKDKKFQTKLKELRKTTRTETWKKQREKKLGANEVGGIRGKKHSHEFEKIGNKGKCKICGLEMEMDFF